MNKKLATLLALLFTDGGVSRHGKNCWRIYFGNKSKVLISLFRDCMIGLFRLENHRVRIRKRRDGVFEAVVDSGEIGDYLTERFGTFRTLKFENGKWPRAELPISEVLESGHVRDFLRVAFSCDGGVSLYTARRDGSQGGTKWLIRKVFLACSHPRLRTGYMVLLRALDIDAKEIPEDGKIRFRRESEIRKFHKLIGFVDGVKVTDCSKFWSGYEKQRVLELLLSSYGNPSKIYNLPKFHLR